MFVLADTAPLSEQLLLLGVPALALILGMAPTPRWTVLIPVFAAVALAIVGISGEDPSDMPGAGVFFSVVFGLAWLAGRGILNTVRGARRRRAQGSSGAG